MTFKTACLAWLGLLAIGCASDGPKPTTILEDVIHSTDQERQEIKELNNRLFASISNAPQSQDYLISEGDLLQVRVFETDELSTEVRVGSRGAVNLPLLGVVEVKGLTASEAEQKIEDAYRRKYLQDPHVNIFVKEQHGSKITLLGALAKPGTYDCLGRRRLLDVLALAGGLSDKAGWMVQVRRKNQADPLPTTYLVDLDELVKKGQAHLNLEINGGDVIFVPEAGVVYVDGAVRKPGTYPIKQTMTIQEAIVAAGGLSTTADEGSIKLVRHMAEGKREVIQLSMQDIRREEARDVKIQDRDVVFVETDKLESLLYSLRLSLGLGLVGVGYNPQ